MAALVIDRAAARGMLTPEVSAPGADGVGSRAQEASSNGIGANSATVAGDGKRIALLRARLALRGITLIDERGGAGFIASRWGLAVDLPDVDAVEAFARRVGAQA